MTKYLERCPSLTSVGCTPPPAANRYIQADSPDTPGALAGVDFDKVIYIIGNIDHCN